jgi:glycerol uptake facilitator-like aquaporin
MATKKASTKKSTSSRATAAKKTTVKKKPAVTAAATASAVKKAPVVVRKEKQLFPLNLPNIILSELLGTFILTIVAVTAFGVSPFAASTAGVLGSWVVDPLFIGLTLMILVMGLGAVSGAHVNPAVTFGFWAMRRIKTVMVPVYWLSQFLGALLAVGVLNVMTSGQFVISLSNFGQLNIPLLFIEIIGTAIFMFGIAGVASRNDVSNGAKAFGVGTALTIGLIAGASMLMLVQKADYKKYTDASSDSSKAATVKVERPLYVNGPVLNPAVALAIREDSSIAQRIEGSSSTTTTPKTESSRFGLEVILGSLIGAALGGNLYLLVAYRPKNEA